MIRAPVYNMGMKVFLLTNDLINKDNVDINQFPNGDFEELLHYIEENIEVAQ